MVRSNATLKTKDVQEHNAAVKSFKACIESLMELETTLEYMPLSPVYEQRFTDKVYVNLLGNMVSKPTTLS